MGGSDRPTSVRRLWPVYLAAPVVLSGIQALLPGLPGIQEALDLTDSEIALVTSVYLFPSVVMALPIGLAADRIGRRAPLLAALVLFGLGGVVLTLFPESFPLLLVVRILQGTAFAAVLSLTITIIGDSLRGPAQVSAQGYRTLAMKVGEAAFPLIGGMMVALSWYAPYAIQIAALPLAAVVWRSLRDVPDARGEWRRGRAKEVFSSFRELPVAVLQASGFLRFFFKFAFLTYLPVLAAERGVTAPTVGTLLAISAGGAAVTGSLTGRLSSRVRPSALMAASLWTIAASFFAIAIDQGLLVMSVAAVAFGLADGLYGILQNAAITQAVPERMRAGFVGVSGTVRNAGKFAAPTLIGALVLSVQVNMAFLIVGVVALLAVVTSIPLRRFDEFSVGLAPK